MYDQISKSVKIIDFSISKTFKSEVSKMWTNTGTPHFKAPEILNGEPYNYKVDIWSVGVLLYVLVYKKFPFDDN